MMNRWGHRYGLGAKFRTPLTIRLEKELAALEKLRDESTILEFRHQGDPPEKYQFRLNGKSLVPGGTGVRLGDVQEFEISLGTDFPRRRPEVRWITPIIHPNISGSNVCLGNFASNWSPAIKLADLVEILWDMSRMAIYNPGHAYGGPSNSTWVELDRKYGFPVDKRPLRDRVLPNDAGSSELRPSGAPDDVVILRDDDEDCMYIG
jgi:ubiquitin-protein ligase